METQPPFRPVIPTLSELTSGDNALLPRELSFTLVVATKGREREIERLFRSLEAQSYSRFDVILVDQNDDDRLAELSAQPRAFPLRRIRTPGQSGACRARNVGWRQARGDWLLFPDDDCWYPNDFLARAVVELAAARCSILTGRAAAENGRSINGRFLARGCDVSRREVWTTSIEWVAFFDRIVLASLGGFDETIGIGAATPWQSCESQDIVLRALESGSVVRYDPGLYGHHAELDIAHPDAALIRKGRAYARGMGHVLRRHRFPWTDRLYWIARPSARAAATALMGRKSAAAYYLAVAKGRLEGVLGHLF